VTLRTRAILLSVLVVGAAGLVWALLLPSHEFHQVSFDYGVCSDNSALKWEVAIIAGVLITGALVSGWVAKCRHS
jgi:hypothetical protein